MDAHSAGIVLPDEVLQALREFARSQPVSMTIRGESMVPVLKDGTKVLVRRSGWYLPGDVLAFRARSGHLVIHRLLGYGVASRGLTFFAKGDSRPQVDPPISRSQIIGKIEATEGNGDWSRISVGQRFGSLGQFLRAIMRQLGRTVFSKHSS